MDYITHSNETNSADRNINNLSIKKEKRQNLSRNDSLNLSDFDLNSSDELSDDDYFENFYRNVTISDGVNF